MPVILTLSEYGESNGENPPHFVLPTYFGSGSGSTVLIPGRIVDVALNFL